MKYRISVVAIVVLAIVLFFANRQESVYVNKIYDSAFEFKKNYLKDTTVNFVNDIETTKKDSVTVFNFTVDLCLEELSSVLSRRATAARALNDYFASRADPSMWSAVLVDSKTHIVLGTFGGEAAALFAGKSSAEPVALAFFDSLCSYRTITDDSTSLTLVYGISKTQLEKTVQQIFTGRVHSYRFTDGAYIFIYKVLDYAGGEQFALRIAHPDVDMLENTYVSTSGGALGDKWYRDMLTGINQEGEYFGAYDFTDPSTGTVTKKLSYSLLYADYDWIITMSTDSDMLTRFIDRSGAVSEVLRFRRLLPVCIAIIAVLIVTLFVQMLRDKRKLQREADSLEERVNWDELTHANTRQFGADELDHVFGNYRNGLASPAIMLLDVDNFKGVNDTYGHDAGDLVLKRIIKTVYANCRASDKIIRWGGDEFILVFPRIRGNGAARVLEKVILAINSADFLMDGKGEQITVSVGASFFLPGDEDISTVLRRCDSALYQAKDIRNNYCIFPEDAVPGEDANAGE